MAKKKDVEKKAKELIVYCGENYSLEKDGVNIYIKSATGFFNEERENAKVKLRISVEEL